MNTSTVIRSTRTQAPTTMRELLQQRIDEGTRRAGATLTTIMNDVPQDQIAPARKLAFASSDTGVVVTVGDSALTTNDWSLGQMAERAGVPAPYLRSIAQAHEEGDDWKRELAAEVLSRHFSHDTGRVLVRSVRGTMRAVLSDKYRRLDMRPLAEALVEEAQKASAIPCDGVATDTRVALKIIHPEIIEPIPGEFMVYGVEWSTSDFGNGCNSIRAFALRAVCLNGMTRENILRQIHLGGRFSDDVELSQRTYQLDTKASVSAVRDVVKGALGPAGIDNMTSKIVEAASKTYSSKQLAVALKNLPKTQAKSIIDAYDSDDVINLPVGENAWRASNAISWVARHTADAEQRLDLERVAGSLV